MKTSKRRSVIIAELSRLSRDGWRGARPEDYRPLEAELAEIDRRRGRPILDARTGKPVTRATVAERFSR